MPMESRLKQLAKKLRDMDNDMEQLLLLNDVEELERSVNKLTAMPNLQ